MKYRWGQFGFVFASLVCAVVDCSAALQTNSWKVAGSGKWETGANWSLNAAPSNTQTALLITNATTKVVTNDSTTANSFPSSMTISNLVISAPPAVANTLFLNNAGTTLPLRVLNSVTISNGGVLQVTGSSLRVDALSGGGINGAGLCIDGVVNLNLGNVFTATNAPTTIGLVKTGQVTVAGGTVTASELDLALNLGSVGILTVSGGQLTILPGEFNLIGVGEGGVGQMIVSNATVTSPIDIGMFGDSQGTLTIAGGASVFSSNLIAGDSGTGTVWITGGQLFATNSATIIGQYAVGQMTLTGGTVTATELDIGYNAGSIGSLTIGGGQLLVTNYDFFSGSIFVGYDGIGRMTVSNGTVLVQSITAGLGAFGQSQPQGTFTVAGGTVSLSSSLDIGVNMVPPGSATGTVWVTGGQITVASGSFNLIGVGEGGVGRMTVSNGTVTSPMIDIGLFGDSQGTLTVAGGSSLVSSNLIVGDAGTGTLWITGGRLIATNAATIIANNFTSTGRVTLSNGTFLARSVNLGVFGGAQGSLTVAGGTNAMLGPLTVGNNSTGTGTVWIVGGQLVITNTPTAVTSGSGFIIDGSVALNAGLIGVTNTPTRIGNVGNGNMTVSGGVFVTRDVTIGGNVGSRGTLTVAGGSTTILSNVVLGDCVAGVIGVVSVTNGKLYVTNAAHNAILNVRNGTLTVNTGGTMVVDKLVVTNACGRVIRNGGTLTYSNLILDPTLSASGDGIPNGWKQQYGLDPFDPNIANTDSDGDGLNNLQEFLAGTDPTNSASALRIIAVAREDGNIRITWMMGSGKTNALQVNAGDGFTNNFTDLFIVTNTVDAVTNYLDVGAATNVSAGYYRVRLVP